MTSQLRITNYELRFVPFDGRRVWSELVEFEIRNSKFEI